jgi:hypothetical protein
MISPWLGLNVPPLSLKLPAISSRPSVEVKLPPVRFSEPFTSMVNGPLLPTNVPPEKLKVPLISSGAPWLNVPEDMLMVPPRVRDEDWVIVPV